MVGMNKLARPALKSCSTTLCRVISSLQCSHGNFVVALRRICREHVLLRFFYHKDNLLDWNTFRNGSLFSLSCASTALDSRSSVLFWATIRQKRASGRRLLAANQAQVPLPALCFISFLFLFLFIVMRTESNFSKLQKKKTWQLHYNPFPL